MSRRFFSRQSTLWRLLVMVALVLPSAACLRGCTSSRPPIHANPNMDQQPKYTAQDSSAFFYDGGAMRSPVPGTVARGEATNETSFLSGRDSTGQFVSNPLPLSDEGLNRGRERYQIFCLPCHGETGDGQSVIRERSGIPSANLLDERIRQLPDGQIYSVITDGLGLMADYSSQISPEDRWQIIHYLRSLQREQQQ